MLWMVTRLGLGNSALSSTIEGPMFTWLGFVNRDNPTVNAKDGWFNTRSTLPLQWVCFTSPLQCVLYTSTMHTICPIYYTPLQCIPTTQLPLHLSGLVQMHLPWWSSGLVQMHSPGQNMSCEHKQCKRWFDSPLQLLDSTSNNGMVWHSSTKLLDNTSSIQ